MQVSMPGHHGQSHRSLILGENVFVLCGKFLRTFRFWSVMLSARWVKGILIFRMRFCVHDICIAFHRAFFQREYSPVVAFHG